jgi:cytochrome c
MHLSELKSKHVSELLDQANSMEIDGANRMRKHDLIFALLKTQAKRGEAIYAEKCSSCHAPDLTGLDQAPPLSGNDFNTNWNDLAVNDLFERIRISMPADKPGSLSRQETADVVAFILQHASFPAGLTELPSQAEALKGIKFVAKKPAGERVAAERIIQFVGANAGAHASQ